MGKMYYAVKVGRNPGVYRRLKSAIDQVRDFSRGEWSRFSTEEEAYQYLRTSICKIDYDWLIRERNKKAFREKVSYVDRSLFEELELTYFYSHEEGTVVVYTDGSAYKGFAGFGAVIVHANQIIHHLCGIKKVKEQKCTSLFSEILAVQASIQYAIERNMQKVVIFHDLSTLGLAAYGQIHIHTHFYRNYQRFIQESLERINIYFIKVKGHRKNPFNEYADQLARQVVSTKKKNRRKGSF